jgi:hypothetical protein
VLRATSGLNSANEFAPEIDECSSEDKGAIMNQAIIEMDKERDRKTCIALDQKVAGANRELAQWLLDHPRYAGAAVASWLGCEKRRIERLRKWAKNGFDERGPQARRRAAPLVSALKNKR